MRSLVVAFTTLGSFVFPNLNIMLALGGSIMGTCMTIVLPVMFYNRAYSQNPKHLKLDKSNRHQDEDRSPLLNLDGEQD